MITPASECNLHEAFEGLCYCTLRLPPMVRLSPPPLHPLPQLWKVPSLCDVTSELGRKDGSTGHWIPDNDSYIVGQFICTVWTSLCDPNWTFHLDRVKVKVSLTTSSYHFISTFTLPNPTSTLPSHPIPLPHPPTHPPTPTLGNVYIFPCKHSPYPQAVSRHRSVVKFSAIIYKREMETSRMHVQRICYLIGLPQ